ncbi:MAG: D-sedoheptulose-7-phosphate isomerase [Egibacteraceae bacterium]
MSDAKTDFGSLYPFLYADESNLEAVLKEVQGSTIQKVEEIVALRNEVAKRDSARMTKCAMAMARSFARGRKLLTFGNGGSSTDAQDMACMFLHPPSGAGDLSADSSGASRPLAVPRPLPALCLTNDIAVMTALSNDVGFDVVFARQIAAFGQAGDIAVGLSTSGNSNNVIRAFDEAGRRGLITVGLSGYEGGKMAEVDTIDYLFVVPSPSVHRIQEAQTTTYHVLWELTQRALLQFERDEEG